MKWIFFSAFLLTGPVAWAQVNSGPPPSEASIITGYSKDYVMFQMTYDGLVGKLPGTAATKGFSRGFNLDLMYDFPVSKVNPHSNYSVGAGLGFSTSSLFLNETAGIADSTTQLTFFQNSPYKRYKIATFYVEIPVELRYRQFPDDANKGFKAAIGLKFGALMNVHTKGVRILNGFREADKVYSKRYFNPYRADATARIGWGNIALFGAYSLTDFLKQNEGPTLYPFSIGICISGM
ncbi:MAG TPA: outer membrane beta-barrel protein [Chitinophagaceae bacterium]|nr:outer membrane beta-barrel protein [Chitinophagaceae bacterium]